MKIGFVLYPSALINGEANGIRSQAVSWKAGLEQLGHEVILLSGWENADLATFDILHLFGPGLWLNELARELCKKNPRVLLSPILDTTKPLWVYRWGSRIYSQRLGLASNPGLLRELEPLLAGVFVRSQHEKMLFVNALGFPATKVRTVPLGCRFGAAIEDVLGSVERTGVLHISSLYQRRKNVLKLIEACESLAVPLRLGGSLRDDEDGATIKRRLTTAKYTTYLGFLSDEALRREYQRAKIFCLPSVYEGVGLVALEAATLGCEVVITRDGGPPDYFGEYATYINPRSLTDIREKLVAAFQKPRQPGLAGHVRARFNLAQSCSTLAEEYIRVLDCRLPLST